MYTIFQKLIKTLKVTVVFLVLFTKIFSQINLFEFNQNPSAYALETFNQIKEVLNVPNNDIYIIANPFVPNAMATLINQPIEFDYWGNPRFRPIKIVLYNPNFMTQMEISTNSKWAGISILAHEIGHHLGNHIISYNPLDSLKHPWQKELEADYYSGMVLAKLGATKDDLQFAQRQMFTLWGSPTHPDTLSRIKSINDGWIDGGGKGDLEKDLIEIWEQFYKQLTKW